MKKIKEETKMMMREMSKEELQNTYGGYWWEVRYENGTIVFIFHYYDDDYEE